MGAAERDVWQELESLSHEAAAEFACQFLRPLLQPVPRAQAAFEPSHMRLRDFVTGITRAARLPHACLLMAVVLVRRMSGAAAFALGRHNIYRLTLTAVILASKQLQDRTYALADWSRIGFGFYSASVLAAFEQQALQLLGWRTHVCPAALETLLLATLPPGEAPCVPADWGVLLDAPEAAVSASASPRGSPA